MSIVESIENGVSVAYLRKHYRDFDKKYYHRYPSEKTGLSVVFCHLCGALFECHKKSRRKFCDDCKKRQKRIRITIQEHRQRKPVNQDFRKEQLLKKGRCPVCEMMLTSPYHTDCGFKKDM